MENKDLDRLTRRLMEGTAEREIAVHDNSVAENLKTDAVVKDRELVLRLRVACEGDRETYAVTLSGCVVLHAQIRFQHAAGAVRSGAGEIIQHTAIEMFFVIPAVRFIGDPEREAGSVTHKSAGELRRFCTEAEEKRRVEDLVSPAAGIPFHLAEIVMPNLLNNHKISPCFRR